MSASHHTSLTLTPIRFLLVVMGSYKQIRNQSFPVLKEVKEDNFDHAFDMIRPSMEKPLLLSFSWLISAFLVIQGVSDVDRNVTENELQRTMDFCKHVLISPTDPEMYSAVSDRLDPKLMDPQGPVMTPDDLEQVLEPGDEEARYVLREVNARKPIHIMYSGTGNFEEEQVEGYSVRCERGHLGLIRV